MAVRDLRDFLTMVDELRDLQKQCQSFGSVANHCSRSLLEHDLDKLLAVLIERVRNGQPAFGPERKAE
jgi:hypothetical protein